MNVSDCYLFLMVCFTLPVLPPAENWLDENTHTHTEAHKLTNEFPHLPHGRVTQGQVML